MSKTTCEKGHQCEQCIRDEIKELIDKASELTKKIPYLPAPYIPYVPYLPVVPSIPTLPYNHYQCYCYMSNHSYYSTCGCSCHWNSVWVSTNGQSSGTGFVKFT